MATSSPGAQPPPAPCASPCLLSAPSPHHTFWVPTLPCTRMCSSGINRLYCQQKDCMRSDIKGWVFRRNFGPTIPPSTGWTHQEHRGCGAGLGGPMWLMLGKGECGPAFIPGFILGKALPARGAGHTVPAKVVNPQVTELLPWHSTAGEHAWAAPAPTAPPLPGALIMMCAFTTGESPSPHPLPPPPPPRPSKAGPQVRWWHVPSVGMQPHALSLHVLTKAWHWLTDDTKCLTKACCDRLPISLVSLSLQGLYHLRPLH